MSRGKQRFPLPYGIYAEFANDLYRIIMKILLTILLIGFSIGFPTTNESLVQPSLAELWGKSAPGTDFAFIDVHNHLAGGPPQRTDYVGAARNALAQMNELGIKKSL